MANWRLGTWAHAQRFFSDSIGLGRMYIYYAVDFLLDCIVYIFNRFPGSIDTVNPGNNSSLKTTGPSLGRSGTCL